MATLADNREARHHYAILDEYEAGLQLFGPEVKSAKTGGASLTGSYATLRKGEAWLIHCRIAPYPRAQASVQKDPLRDRRLLLKHRELLALAGKIHGESLTLVPLSLYTKSGLVKVRIALARGLKKHDKRVRIAKRDAERRIQRVLRRRAP